MHIHGSCENIINSQILPELGTSSDKVELDITVKDFNNSPLIAISGCVILPNVFGG